MEGRPVSHRSIDADEDGLLRQWSKWRRAAALSRSSRRARRVAVPASPTCPCGGRMRRVPKPKPTAGEERADGACGGPAPVLPPAAWYPYDLRCTECDGETCWRRRIGKLRGRGSDGSHILPSPTWPLPSVICGSAPAMLIIPVTLT